MIYDFDICPDRHKTGRDNYLSQFQFNYSPRDEIHKISVTQRKGVVEPKMVHHGRIFEYLKYKTYPKVVITNGEKSLQKVF